MPSRNVAVQETVYEALRREKRSGESFTDLFRRLLEQREGLPELAGAWGKYRAGARRAALRALRIGREDR
ncbi:MAG: antitoxin VapB family protein [Thermoplasmata archaeon]